MSAHVEIIAAERSNGTWVFRHGGHEAGSLGALSRKLVVAGVEDRPWRCGGLHGRSLHRLACITVAERDGGGPRHERFNAPPGARLHPRVAEVLARYAPRASGSASISAAAGGGATTPAPYPDKPLAESHGVDAWVAVYGERFAEARGGRLGEAQRTHRWA